MVALEWEHKLFILQVQVSLSVVEQRAMRTAEVPGKKTHPQPKELGHQSFVWKYKGLLGRGSSRISRICTDLTFFQGFEEK